MHTFELFKKKLIKHRDQLNDLLLPYYETKYQFSDKIANTVTDALENIAFCDGELDENAFQQPMEKFKSVNLILLKQKIIF